MTSDARLPRLDRERMFIGDGGLETSMIFRDGIELPCFASFLLLRGDEHVQLLRRYYAAYLEVAHRHQVGFTLDTPTWRANADWGERLGYSVDDLEAVNRAAVELGVDIRSAHETEATPIAVCGTIGPRGDAYHQGSVMTIEEAQRYHQPQIHTFAEAGADMVGAYTLAYADEAAGMVRAAAATGIPASISFTVEIDGRLPSGESIGEAIERVDAQTEAAAAYFMINCAHPTHFEAVVADGGPWRQRVGGVRSNASRKSHAELDQAPSLDSGDPAELAQGYRRLRPGLPRVRVLGGCCGTDERHVDEICRAWL